VRTGALGANTEIKVTPPAGTRFNVAAPLSNVVLGTATATALVRTQDSIVAITSAAFTGTVKVTNLTGSASGGAAIDSLRTVGSFNVAAAPFPGTVTQLGGGGYMDTVRVVGGAQADFTTTGASASNVTINGARAIVLRRAADTLYVLPALAGGPSTVSVSNVLIGTATVSSLTTSGTITVAATFTEANEPTNDAPGAVAISLAGATAANPLIIYGAVDGNGVGLGVDADDFFAFTLAAAGPVNIRVEMAGTGAGGATNPDIDLLVCNAACSAFPFGFPGATAANPENHVIASAPAGTYNVYINGWDTATIRVGYRLLIWQ